jgi:hypothetical protein
MLHIALALAIVLVVLIAVPVLAIVALAERSAVTGGGEKWRKPFGAFKRSDRDRVDYRKIALTEEGTYSALMPKAAAQAMKVFEPLVAEPGSKVLDLTGGNGTDAINIAAWFPGTHVTAVELNPEHAKIIAHNAKATGVAQSISVLERDSVAFVKETGDTFAVVYADPPWGGKGAGRSWEQDPAKPLELSGENITAVARLVLRKGIAPVFVLKAPPAYSPSGLESALSPLGATVTETVIEKNGRPTFKLLVASAT